jgi:hypothetical protein
VLWRLEEYLAAPTLKGGVLLAVVLAMLFLAGAPQYVFFAGLLVFARLVHYILFSVDGRRDRALRALRCSAWLLLGLAFCAPQLFPTLELIGQMHRSSLDDYSESTSYFMENSLSPKELGGLVFPLSRGNPLNWEACGFVGGAVLLLTLGIYLGKHPQRHLWAAVAALGLILALGDAVPFYSGFAKVVPGAGWFRGPGRYLLLFTLAMAGLAGLGFEAVWNRGPRGFRILGGILAFASLVQLGAFAMPCFRGHIAWMQRMSPGLRDDLKYRCALEGRVANGTPDVQFIGQCQAEGIDHVCGYEPMMLRRYAEAMNAARGAGADVPMVILASVAPHPTVRMLSTRVWMISDDPASKLGPYRTQSFKDPLPRSWVVNNAVVIEDKEKRLKTIAYGPWDPERTVILESYPKFAPPEPTEKPAGTSRVLSRKPGFYEIEAECDARAFLVLSEAYYPGWSATIDGHGADVEVLPANHLIQAVWMPKGKHVVRFEYRSTYLPFGFVVALLAALVPVGLWLHGRRKNPALVDPA